MNSHRFFPLLSVAIAVGVLAATPLPAGGWRDLKYPPLHEIQFPEPVRFELANGLVVYLIEDHEIPLAGVHALIRAGGRWEQPAKTGLAAITGTVMRTGGSTARNGDQLDDELDRLGAWIEIGVGRDQGRVYASMLREDLGRGIDIIADLLQHPAFPLDKIELAKIRWRDSIARRNDEPSGIAFREFNKILYGKDSPYAAQAEYATIDAITRDDLVAFHREFFQPENVILGVEGDFNPAEVRARIEQAFGAWPRGGRPRPAVPSVVDTARDHAAFYEVIKTDMRQSWVLMGMLGGRRDDPDFCALQVMGQVLGGGLSSRLFSNVRSAQGLAYAVWSGWYADWDHAGTFFAGGSSKPETTVRIYRAILAEVQRMAESGASDDELARAKDYILKGLGFEFDHTRKIMERLMTYEYFGYPKDYLQQYQVRISEVTRDDVARVARKYLTPGKFAVLFSGNGRYEAALASLGPVQAIDITIPPPRQP